MSSWPARAKNVLESGVELTDEERLAIAWVAGQLACDPYHTIKGLIERKLSESKEGS